MQNFRSDQIIVITVTCNFIRYIISSCMYCGWNFFCPFSITQLIEQSGIWGRSGIDQFLFVSGINQICFRLRCGNQLKICFLDDKSNRCFCRKLIICIINCNCPGCISACLRLTAGYCNIAGIPFCQTFCGCRRCFFRSIINNFRICPYYTDFFPGNRHIKMLFFCFTVTFSSDCFIIYGICSGIDGGRHFFLPLTIIYLIHELSFLRLPGCCQFLSFSVIFQICYCGRCSHRSMIYRQLVFCTC